MSPASSSSTMALAVCLAAAIITTPQNAAAFAPSRIPSPQTCHHRPMTAAAIGPLHSTATPMRPMEEEKEKNKNNKNNSNNNDGNASIDENTTTTDNKREWKQVVGGFVPNILKRDTVPYPPVQNVDTLEDYKNIVVDEQDAIVVVRFFAPWCKSCKAAHPLFKKMASEHSSSPVKFVEVPLTKDTAYIHEGLGVPSVPFGHIYHPEVGLVEEKKINKKVFKEFREALDCYVMGSCDIPIEEGEEQEEELDGGFQ